MVFLVKMIVWAPGTMLELPRERETTLRMWSNTTDATAAIQANTGVGQWDAQSLIFFESTDCKQHSLPLVKTQLVATKTVPLKSSP